MICSYFIEERRCGGMPNITIRTSGNIEGGPYDISGWQGLQITRTIDAGADAFAFSIPWKPTPKNKKLFKAYRPIVLYIMYGDETIITGRMEQLIPRWNGSERSLEIQGRGLTGTLIDASAGPPFEFSEEISFNDIARKIAQSPDGQFGQSGITVYASPNFTVPTASIEPGQTVFNFLSKIASTQNLFALPQPNGSLLFSQLSSRRKPVVDITEGQAPIQSITTNHDSTKRFYEYVVIQSSEGNFSDATAIDTGVDNRIRWRQITETQQATKSLNESAKFAKAKGLIDSYSASITVTGWEYNGVIWKAGDIVRVKAPSAMIYNPSNLIIRRATLQLDESGGKVTQLDLALPELYDGQEVTQRPWAV